MDIWGGVGTIYVTSYFMFCTNCGKEQPEAAHFCTDCGAPVNGTEESNFSTDTDSKKGRWARITVLTLLIVGVAVVAWLDATTEEYEEYESYSALGEMGAYLEPVGYFDDPELLSIDSILDDEWFSHLHYFEGKDFESAIERAKDFSRGKEGAFRSVVKVVCEDAEYPYVVGSGTNLDPEGIVLTNYHVVEGAGELGCLVGLPDPATGLVQEVYWATPIVDDDSDTVHDLAFLAIVKPVFDEEDNVYGYYDRFYTSSFPVYEPVGNCSEEQIELGDEVLVMGYPTLGGGALTVTNGIISSLYSYDNYLITSAKLNGGNSGGLATNSDGCFLGVPTAAYSEEGDENFGEIIDGEYVIEFMSAIEDEFQEYDEQNLM